MDEITPSLNRIFELVSVVTRRIEEINEAIEYGSVRLRECQPRWGGAILLYFKKHGPKPDCFGCPHLDWKIMLPNKHSRTKVCLSNLQGNPVKAVVRHGQHRDSFPEVKATISYIQDLAAEKRSYTQVLGNLRRCMSNRLDTSPIAEAGSLSAQTAEMVKLLSLRLNRIDRELRQHAESLDALQPGEFPGKVKARIYGCSEDDCYSCSHLRWVAFQPVKRSRTRLEMVRVASPLKRLPQKPERAEKTEIVRQLIKRMSQLLEEKKAYQGHILTLAKVFHGRYQTPKIQFSEFSALHEEGETSGAAAQQAPPAQLS